MLATFVLISQLVAPAFGLIVFSEIGRAVSPYTAFVLARLV